MSKLRTIEVIVILLFASFLSSAFLPFSPSDLLETKTDSELSERTSHCFLRPDSESNTVTGLKNVLTDMPKLDDYWKNCCFEFVSIKDMLMSINHFYLK